MSAPSRAWPPFSRLSLRGAQRRSNLAEPGTAARDCFAALEMTWFESQPKETATPDYPLPPGNPEALGFALKPLEHLDHLIREHIEEGRYPGAQIALARNGQLALFRSCGEAKTEGQRAPAGGDTLFLLFSQTKVLTSAAVWTLVEEGRVSVLDQVA